jgi:hypothetical protein
MSLDRILDKVRQWRRPWASGSEPLEIHRAILEDVEAQSVAAGGGRRVFPFDRVEVKLLAATPEEKVRLEAVAQEAWNLPAEAAERLRARGVRVPEGLVVTVEVVAAAALAPGGRRYAVTFSKTARQGTPSGPARAAATAAEAARAGSTADAGAAPARSSANAEPAQVRAGANAEAAQVGAAADAAAAGEVGATAAMGAVADEAGGGGGPAADAVAAGGGPAVEAGATGPGALAGASAPAVAAVAAAEATTAGAGAGAAAVGLIGERPAARQGHGGRPLLRLAVLKGKAVREAYSCDADRLYLGRLEEVLDGAGRVRRRNDVAFLEEGDLNQTVSREHARIAWEPESRAFWLRDEGSSSGTVIFRAGRSIEVSRHDRRGVRLETGDEVYLGRAALRVEIGDAIHSAR